MTCKVLEVEISLQRLKSEGQWFAEVIYFLKKFGSNGKVTKNTVLME